MSQATRQRIIGSGCSIRSYVCWMHGSCYRGRFITVMKCVNYIQ